MARSDIKLTTSRSWQDSYAAAIRWTKSEEPVQTAETEIHKKTAGAFSRPRRNTRRTESTR